MADTGTPQGGGGFGASLKSKFGPLPVWAWLGIVTVLLLGYWLYEQHKSGGTSSGTGTSPGGSSAAPGVVVINQDDAGESTDEDSDEDGDGKKKKKKPPKKKHHPRGFPPVEPKTRQVTASKDETLRQLATQRHWSANTLRQVEQENVMQGGGHFTGKTELTKGEEVLRPLRS